MEANKECESAGGSKESYTHIAIHTLKSGQTKQKF